MGIIMILILRVKILALFGVLIIGGGIGIFLLLQDIRQEPTPPPAQHDAAEMQLDEMSPGASSGITPAASDAQEGQTQTPEEEETPHVHDSDEDTTSPPFAESSNLSLTLADGFRIALFSPSSIGPVRFMAFSPDDILFVSMPSAAGLYNENRTGGAIFALPDRDQDGTADEVKTVLAELRSGEGRV